DLGAALAISRQHVEADAGRQRALAVLPGHHHQAGAEPTLVVACALPPERRTEDPALPVLEVKGLPSQAAVLEDLLRLGPLDVRELLDGLADPVRGLRVEVVREAVCSLPGQVARVTRARQADPFTGRYRAVQDGAAVAGSAVDVGERSADHRRLALGGSLRRGLRGGSLQIELHGLATG